MIPLLLQLLLIDLLPLAFIKFQTKNLTVYLFYANSSLPQFIALFKDNCSMYCADVTVISQNG